MTQAPDWADEVVYQWPLDMRADDIQRATTALRTAYTRGRVEGLREAAEIIDGNWANKAVIRDDIRTLADKIEREGRE